MARTHDWFTEAFGAAVTDIRQKLVEEAWFGRTVTPRPLASRDAEHTPRNPAVDLGWEQPHSRTPPSPEHGIDR